MPYKSEKQRRFMHAEEPEIAARWDKKYGKKVAPKKKSKKAPPKSKKPSGAHAQAAALEAKFGGK